MAGNQTDKRKWMPKTYWKFENVETMHQKWTESFHTSTPSSQSIYKRQIRGNKFSKEPPKNPDIYELLPLGKMRCR